MTNISWLQFAAQLLQILQKYWSSRENLVHAMDFASFGSDKAYLELYFSRKCETQQTYKQTMEQLHRRQEIHSLQDHEIHHHEITFFELG